MSEKQLEAVGVRGPYDTEMTAIGCPGLCDPEPFGGGDDGRIDGSEREVVVLGDQLGDSDQV
jgi:hypothetical protein